MRQIDLATTLAVLIPRINLVQKFDSMVLLKRVIMKPGMTCELMTVSVALPPNRLQVFRLDPGGRVLTGHTDRHNIAASSVVQFGITAAPSARR